nr:MAG: CI repressor [Bacteriophage sp.]
MSIAYNIRKLREVFDLTQADLAEVAGVTKNAVSQWENGRAEPRMGAIERMAACYGLRESYLIEDGGMDQIDPVTRKPRKPAYIPDGAIPVYSSGEAAVPLLTLGRVHAGALTDGEAAEHRVEVPASVCSRHPRAFALVVEGNCMNRVIPEGAHVLVDPDREPSNGSIAVVETEAYQAVMRRWYRGSSTLMLTADSYEEQEDLVFTMDDGPVRVIGTVVWYQSPEEME